MADAAARPARSISASPGAPAAIAAASARRISSAVATACSKTMLVMTSPACINMADMKLSLFRIVLICPSVAMGLDACSQSPYYTAQISLAPRAGPPEVPGRPLIDGEALHYALPPPASGRYIDITGRPAAPRKAHRTTHTS